MSLSSVDLWLGIQEKQMHSSDFIGTSCQRLILILQNDLKWDVMTFLIIALSCHYFENGIKQESCMYDQYFLAAGMPDQCYLLELPLLIFQFSKFSFFVGFDRWWQSTGDFSCNSILLKNVLRRDANCQVEYSRSFCECCSLQCIIISHVASIYLLLNLSTLYTLV